MPLAKFCDDRLGMISAAVEHHEESDAKAGMTTGFRKIIKESGPDAKGLIFGRHDDQDALLALSGRRHGGGR